MQSNQQRPVVTQGPEPVSNIVAGLAAGDFYGKPLAEPKRVSRDDRGLNRFGPRPGEVFSDEARFGSFS